MKGNIMKRLHFQISSLVVLAALCLTGISSCSLMPQKIEPANDTAFSRAIPKPVKGFSVANGQLLDAKGKPFVMRGVSFDNDAYLGTENSKLLRAIRQNNANTLRIDVASSFFDIDKAILHIELSIANRMITVIDVTDTGHWEDLGDFGNDVDNYWALDEVKAFMFGKEDRVILGLGDDLFLSKDAATLWYPLISKSIKRMRALGYKHTFLINAPNLGSDSSLIMRKYAKQLFNDDPDRNIIFGIDIKDKNFAQNPQSATRQSFSNYVSLYITNKLVLVVDCFAETNGTLIFDDYAIMGVCQQHNLGYFAWKWAGYSQPENNLVTDWNNDLPTNRGKVIFDSPNGLRTAQTCSIFNYNPRPQSVGIRKYVYTYSRSGEKETHSYLRTGLDISNFINRADYPTSIDVIGNSTAGYRIRLNYTTHKDIEFDFDAKDPYKTYSITKVKIRHAMTVQMLPDGSWRIGEGGGGPGWGAYQMIAYTAY
jgi:mannan endo-1,4-beta-mannosidase